MERYDGVFPSNAFGQGDVDNVIERSCGCWLVAQTSQNLIKRRLGRERRLSFPASLRFVANDKKKKVAVCAPSMASRNFILCPFFYLFFCIHLFRSLAALLIPKPHSPTRNSPNVVRRYNHPEYPVVAGAW